MCTVVSFYHVDDWFTVVDRAKCTLHLLLPIFIFTNFFILIFGSFVKVGRCYALQYMQGEPIALD